MAGRPRTRTSRAFPKTLAGIIATLLLATPRRIIVAHRPGVGIRDTGTRLTLEKRESKVRLAKIDGPKAAPAPSPPVGPAPESPAFPKTPCLNDPLITHK